MRSYSRKHFTKRELWPKCAHGEVAATCNKCWLARQPKCVHGEVAVTCGRCWAARQPKCVHGVVAAACGQCLTKV